MAKNKRIPENQWSHVTRLLRYLTTNTAVTDSDWQLNGERRRFMSPYLASLIQKASEENRRQA